MGVSHVSNSEDEQMTKSVNILHVIISNTVTDAFRAHWLSASSVCLFTAHLSECFKCCSFGEVQRNNNVFSCFHVFSAEAHNTLLGILKQALADLTANGMKVHCLGISCIEV